MLRAQNLVSILLHRPLQLVICAAVLAGSVSSNVAHARPTKIALTKVEGDAAGVGKAVSDALEDSELVIVPSRQVDRTLVRLGLDDNFGDRGAAKLGEELEVDAVVRGAYDRRRSKMRFTIFANGKRGKPFSVEVSDIESDKFRRLVRTAVMAKLTAVRKEAEAAADLAASSDAKLDKTGATDTKKPKAAAAPAAADDKSTKAKDPGPVTTISMADDGTKKRAKAKAGKDTATKTTASKDATSKDATTKDASKDATSKDATSKDATSKDAATKVADATAADDSAKPKAKPAEDTPPAEEPAPKAVKTADTPFAAGAKSGPSSDTQTASAQPAAAADRPVAARPNTRLAAAKPQLASARDDDGDSVGSSTRVRAESSGRAEPRGANLAAVRAELGVSVSSRALSFESTSGTTAPKPFNSAAFPGGRFEGELYPLAMGDARGILAGFGIAGSFDEAVPLTVHAPTEPTVALKATQRAYSIGLRYRIAFGHTPTSPTLTLGAGYASRTFSVDRTGLANPSALDMPNVDYTLYDPGLAFRLPLGRMFAVTVAGRGLIVADAGQIQQADQYGTATVMGLSGSAGLEVLFGSHVALRVAGEATQISFTFTGNGALSNNRDGNTATVDVKNASDSYIGGVATLAVMY
jgi:hypothetical protein